MIPRHWLNEGGQSASGKLVSFVATKQDFKAFQDINLIINFSHWILAILFSLNSIESDVG